MTVMQRTRLMIALTVVGIALGLMVSVQFKNVHGTFAFSTMTQQDISMQQLVTKVKALKDYNDSHEKTLGQLNNTIASFEQKASAHQGQAHAVADMLSRVRVLAGSVPVKGPGIVLTINDSQQIGSSANVEPAITHDWDVRSVINELFVAGAEAISVNDVRVVSTTGVFCIGPVIEVNDQRLSPPYVLKAIGSARDLRAALLLPGGALDQLKASDRNLQVSDPKIMPSVEIPAYTGTIATTSVTN